MQFSRGRLDNPFVNLSLAELLQLILTKAGKREKESKKTWQSLSIKTPKIN